MGNCPIVGSCPSGEFLVGNSPSGELSLWEIS